MTSDETANNAREELIKELLQRKEQRKKKKIGIKTFTVLEPMTI